MGVSVLLAGTGITCALEVVENRHLVWRGVLIQKACGSKERRVAGIESDGVDYWE